MLLIDNRWKRVHELRYRRRESFLKTPRIGFDTSMMKASHEKTKTPYLSLLGVLL